MLIDVPEHLLKKCRYCGDYFFPASGRQEVCKKDACQRKRVNDFVKAYRNRKKEKKAE